MNNKILKRDRNNNLYWMNQYNMNIIKLRYIYGWYEHDTINMYVNFFEHEHGKLIKRFIRHNIYIQFIYDK